MIPKSSVSCTTLTCSRQNPRDRNKENLTENTGVVLAKYHPKVKLKRISTTLEYQSWEKLRVPWFVRDFGFL